MAKYENSKNKIFILENLVVKKEHQIVNYKEKYETLMEAYERKISIEKEVIVVEPSNSIMSIHEELLIYKNSKMILTCFKPMITI